MLAVWGRTLAPAVVRPDRRTLADLAAGTTVERAEPVRSAGTAGTDGCVIARIWAIRPA